MISFSDPGGDTVIIRRRPTAVTRDRLQRAQHDPADDALIPKTGCHVETQRPAETETLTTNRSEIAWFFLPLDDDTRAIKPSDAFDWDGRTFEMTGPRVIERIDGEEIQVWCTAQWQG